MKNLQSLESLEDCIPNRVDPFEVHPFMTKVYVPVLSIGTPKSIALFEREIAH